MPWSEYGDAAGANVALPTAVFTLLSIALIYPPDEFVSAGATFESLFSWYLGEPTLNVVLFQCKKVVINRCCIAALPSLLSFYLFFAEFEGRVPSPFFSCLFTASFALLASSVAYFCFHHVTNYRETRQMRELALYSNDVQRLQALITAEYLDFNNFSVSFAHSSKFMVSRSWVFNIKRYDFTIVHVSDVSFEAVDAATVDLNTEQPNDHLQFLIIEAKITNKPIKNFTFRIRSDQFRDLQGNVERPIQIARNVILHQTLNERFVKAFIEYVTDNPLFYYKELSELEPCFGCSADPPNVKIVHRCQRMVEGDRPCRDCHCRPMWCVACLARVFANKQAQDRPEGWLDGQATCPTCRAEFCVLDVSFVTDQLPANEVDSQ